MEGFKGHDEHGCLQGRQWHGECPGVVGGRFSAECLMINRVGLTVPNDEGDVDGEGRGTASVDFLQGRECPGVTRVGLAKLFNRRQIDLPLLVGCPTDACYRMHSQAKVPPDVY